MRSSFVYPARGKKILSGFEIATSCPASSRTIFFVAICSPYVSRVEWTAAGVGRLPWRRSMEGGPNAQAADDHDRNGRPEGAQRLRHQGSWAADVVRRWLHRLGARGRGRHDRRALRGEGPERDAGPDPLERRNRRRKGPVQAD